MSDTKKSMRSYLVVLVATVMGLAFAYFSGVGEQYSGAYPVIFVCGLIAFALNWLVYIPSLLAQTEKYFDLVGAITYLSVIGAACLMSDNLDIRAYVVAAMVGVWCIRLGTFLFKRIAEAGGDSRFDQLKTNPARFLVTWTLQAVWVIFTAAAALAIIAASERVEIGLFFWVGALVWLAGFVIEVVADNQKSAFKSDPANDGKFINVGLWSWSQHPNYFGEIVLWLGIAIMSVPLLSGWTYLVLFSPVFVFLLLTRISGIPMLDAKAQKKWGDQADYQQYRKNTSKLVPLPPKD